ncbi:aminotransferase class I/II-fold pyridoxal phosphate-dependent enzyme [Modestobacter sp. I12A-02628]|uniref:Aminotransferase class I/II-fold pyridoxal phosphate-dependent enzyme n=1 Tax=Goekera deserti TaxID=2497753 RepID=A0A7K3WG59_9ACTN|nr:aminotransferase class I/II-fold pyridoxal phosphate-dependent enzyme [Goekera deserti]MPQ99642.1 aminotransferase class I/II-fold pyridoxal phosphate-dependent enzyme [Goekera deserti]NDI46348.1 aminotransferase class I/II-fold pyridoxal phosphate-dependent enzyme [Goekera deserti]NEL54720.1 aminotransferase class I/II-fold pyridoxal phosphate-dependent enzyme [Goekera deserti]
MDEQTRQRRDACTRFLVGDGPVSPARHLAALDSETVADVYGDGGVVAELETRVADLLGTEAAVFLPSGTMAQGAALRVHADARTSRTVLWHPTCHLELYELQAHAQLHRLTGRRVGAADRLMTLTDLAAVAEPYAALLVELPQREIGGQLPDWAELQALVAHARGRGAAVHCDGARLWEAAAGYGRDPADLAALFDTVYVSFYKGIGALPGCCLAGSTGDVAQVREWRRRLGGTLHGLWPLAASALALLPERLAEMPARQAAAVRIAAALQAVDGVTVVPAVPQTPMMHLLLRTSVADYRAAAERLATEDGVWVWPEARPTADPGVVLVELSVGRATVAWDAADVAHVLGRLAGPVAAAG